MEEIPLKQRNIVLVPFPFSDQSGTKVRPALILSNTTFNATSQDVIICAITTQHAPGATIPLSQKNLETGKLYDNCFIKPENLCKIHRNKIIKNIGTVNKETLAKTNKAILTLIAPTD